MILTVPGPCHLYSFLPGVGLLLHYLLVLVYLFLHCLLVLFRLHYLLVHLLLHYLPVEVALLLLG